MDICFSLCCLLGAQWDIPGFCLQISLQSPLQRKRKSWFKITKWFQILVLRTFQKNLILKVWTTDQRTRTKKTPKQKNIPFTPSIWALFFWVFCVSKLVISPRFIILVFYYDILFKTLIDIIIKNKWNNFTSSRKKMTADSIWFFSSYIKMSPENVVIVLALQI